MTITIVGGGNPSGPTFPVQRSVRLRASASAYFNRTATAANRSQWTWSGWIKRGALGGGNIFGAGTSTNYFIIGFNASDQLRVVDVQSSAVQFDGLSTAVFRDPSSWYHIVVVMDTAQGTAANRLKVWVNNVLYSLSQYPGSGATPVMNAATTNYIGNLPSVINTVDGYIAEIYFVNAQPLTPASFGAYNQYGVWSPSNYSGTYGTNGFYLNFQDNSAVTTSSNVGIGKDSSGNGNYWTSNSINVSPYTGTPPNNTSYDSMLDVPTLTSATNANFATLNPLSQSTGGSAVPSNGNLTLSQATNNIQVTSTIGMSSGKWYYEHGITALGGENSVGIGPFAVASAAGTTTGQYGYYFNGNKYISGAISAYGASYTTGDIIGVAYDADTGSLTFYKNGVSQGVATTGITGTMFALAATRSAGGQNTSDLNFGQRPFSYTPPTGFQPLNTYNLPAPTIPNGAAYFAATLWAGNNGTQSILNSTNTTTGVSFQPDFVWLKQRSPTGTGHIQEDAVRGALQYLGSELSSAESTLAGSVTAFNSNGFSIGNQAGTNATGSTYVGWSWKASNAAAVTNTNGTIPSQVSANPTAGFSIVTYTGTAANATVGHGLNGVPKFIIVKNRDSGAIGGAVYHESLGVTKYLQLFQTTTGNARDVTDNTAWNGGSPTFNTSVFSVGSLNRTNSAQRMVAYCWSEIPGFSKFGSYTGNGANDGPFVYTGMRPRWLLLKNTGGVASWYCLDSSRNVYNVVNAVLVPNTSAAEVSITSVDFLSNGFKLRTTTTDINGSGTTYIYAAFAENPFNYSLAR
jgi:hypothetical protein